MIRLWLGLDRRQNPAGNSIGLLNYIDYMNVDNISLVLVSSPAVLLHSSSSILRLPSLVLLRVRVATPALVVVAVGPELNDLKNSNVQYVWTKKKIPHLTPLPVSAWPPWVELNQAGLAPSRMQRAPPEAADACATARRGASPWGSLGGRREECAAVEVNG